MACTACHDAAARMNLKGELGYALKAAEATVCSQCHGPETNPGFTSVHRRHVTQEG